MEVFTNFRIVIDLFEAVFQKDWSRLNQNFFYKKLLASTKITRRVPELFLVWSQSQY